MFLACEFKLTYNVENIALLSCHNEDQLHMERWRKMCYPIFSESKACVVGGVTLSKEDPKAPFDREEIRKFGFSRLENHLSIWPSYILL